jgi:hypothetical protein
MVVKIPNDKANLPGKPADAELHHHGAPTASVDRAV